MSFYLGLRYIGIPNLTGLMDGDARTKAFAICKSLDDRKEKDKGSTAPWEAEYAPLCSAFQDILKAMKGPLEGHERKRLMRGVPYFKEIEVEPPVNNHRGDKNHESEKVHRVWESSLFGDFACTSCFGRGLVSGG